MIYKYKGHSPDIHPDAFVAPEATVIGRVTIGKDASKWPQAVVRGDMNYISVGEGTSVQDGCVLHNTEENPLIVGSFVTLGHDVVLHACTVEDESLIGMGAFVLDGATIAKRSIVAAGSVVTPGKSFPEGCMIMGYPAKVVRSLSEEEIKGLRSHAEKYVKLAHTHVETLERIY